jgi:acyl-CoA synthetase (AMP-forming)/AMP-acid ligase II
VRDSSSGHAILEAWARTRAHAERRAAVLAPDGRTLRTRGEIEAESRELEARLAGLAPRSVVAVAIGNSESWPALLLAMWRRALIPLPLGGHMQPAELELALQSCGAAAVVNAEFAIERRAVREPEWGLPAPEFLKLTSGTTNAPRAIRFRTAQLVADCEQICATMGITERDLNYGVIPFSHSYGFSNLLTPLLCRGVPLVAAEDRLPRAILDGLARSGATVFPGTPVFFDKLAELEEVPPLPALWLCISAGAPLPRTVGEKFTAKYGRRIHTFYGASECGGIGYDARNAGGYEEGFVGTPMRGVRVEGGDGDGAAIAVHSAAVGDGYFPEAEPETLGPGRFVPADLVRRTEQGMYLVGRVSDVINVAGRKLNPLEVEARLADFPGVRQAVVFGVRSELRGEEAIACVAGHGLEREALLRFCRERLSAWQVPRDVWVVPAIPVNERGKISRRALAEQYRRRCES